IVSGRSVLIFLLIGPAACGQSAASSKPETIVIATANIEGVVIDSMTGQPLAGVRLTLRRIDAQSASQQSPAPIAATTDPQGQFILEDVLIGRFRLFASRPGYVSMEYGARAPGASGLPIELTGEQDIRDIAFR